MKNISVGSVCSGIEAASVAWGRLNFHFEWFSEIEPFPSRVLASKYPSVLNVGDMRAIPALLRGGTLCAPELICGGTPCQAFSLAGWKKGLRDDRGNLTLNFVDIIDANDKVRKSQGQDNTIVLWENVEGVLRDKTNAFGCFLASLAGLDSELHGGKWPNAGVIHGPRRNIAWRVLDAKYFGLPQQRRRLYLLAGGKDFFPENILFDGHPRKFSFEDQPLSFKKDKHSIQIFRAYTDCLYAAYGTKWNGNAAAYNGSLYVCQNGRLRRFSPLECERLMGLPDDYTFLPGSRPTTRYQSIGNSWAVPVIKWIGRRIEAYKKSPPAHSVLDAASSVVIKSVTGKKVLFFPVTANTAEDRQKSFLRGPMLNGSEMPQKPMMGNLADIIDVKTPENFYITPVGCMGILRRKDERGLRINPQLERILRAIASEWSASKIERISRKQKRGRFSTDAPRVAARKSR